MCSKRVAHGSDHDKARVFSRYGSSTALVLVDRSKQVDQLVAET